MRKRHSMKMGRALAVVGVATLLVGALSTGTAAQNATPETGEIIAPAIEPGGMTAVRPYLVPAEGAAVTITPLLTAGDKVGDYEMAGVPDGLGAFLNDEGAVVFVNHELSAEDDDNLTDSRVSRLVLDPETGGILSATYVLTGAEGYWALCSASLAGPEVGFDPPVFLTGEEATEGPHGGVAMAIDAIDGTVTELPWLGLFEHENQVVIPGFEGKTVVIATDDNSDGSELYMYLADSPADFLAGKGQLHVFKADDAAGTLDVEKGKSLTGTFIPVDQRDNVDAATLQAKVEADGAFHFIRLEDVTWDRTTPNTIYFADTGDDEEPNLREDGTPVSAAGRLYTMTLDPADPTKVTNFTVLLDGDAGDDMHNPDNIDADATTIMIQEDPSDLFKTEGPEGLARILAYSIADGTLTPIAMVDQADGEAMIPEGEMAGDWESSGILNVSEIFGEGTWLTDVQASTLMTPQFGGEDLGGQLLLIRTS